MVQAPTGSQNNTVKAPKRSRDRTENGVEVPILGEEDAMSQMSQGSGGSRTWEKRRGRDSDWTSRKPFLRRPGQNHRIDKSAIGDVINDPAHHHWMQMILQGVHQALIQSRKAGGQVYDTWICDVGHTLARHMLQQTQGILEQATTLREARAHARRESKEPAPPMPNPAANLMARFVHQLKTNNIGPNANDMMKEIWDHITARHGLIDDFSYFSVTAVSEGKETRIMIGMRGWAMRAKLLEAMKQLGNDVRYSPGGGPPGYMERQLGEYCRELKKWED